MEVNQDSSLETQAGSRDNMVVGGNNLGENGEEEERVEDYRLLSQNSNVTEITTDSVVQDNALSTEEKKRKLRQLYYGTHFQDEDKYEVQKVRRIVRESVFKKVKFCRGEGTSGSDKRSPKKQALTKVFGKSHEAPDLTERKGYAYEVLKLSGNGEDVRTLTRRALWWKTYNVYVPQEVRQLRSSMNFNIKKSCVEGKLKLYTRNKVECLIESDHE